MSGDQMPSSAEVMAEVVRNLRLGRTVNTLGRREAQVLGDMNLNTSYGRNIIAGAVPVDVTPVHQMFMGGKGHEIYALLAAPPWDNALLTYVNKYQNVWAMHLVATDFLNDPFASDAAFRSEIEWQPFPPADHTIDWTLVRWVMSIQVYIGGIGHGTWMPTTGPMMIWRLAVYPDGTIADINWTRISDAPVDEDDIYDNVLGTVLETLNICNCVNVQVAEADSKRPRAEQRRLDRIGVRFSEIHIKPLRKSYQGNGTPLGAMPAAHGVRGHYATFGRDGKGLLFGKLSGRFWIPPHIRGSKEIGEVVQSYVAETP